MKNKIYFVEKTNKSVLCVYLIMQMWLHMIYSNFSFLIKYEEWRTFNNQHGSTDEVLAWTQLNSNKQDVCFHLFSLEDSTVLFSEPQDAALHNTVSMAEDHHTQFI